MKSILTIIKIVTLGVFIFLSTENSQAQNDHSDHGSNDRPSIHGMLVVGKTHIYLSHLPMFHSPHDYQIILEAALGERIHETYLRDQKNNPEVTVYTLVPEPFILPNMVHDPKPFSASLYRGHFERGGTAIATNFNVNIRRLIYFKKFESNTTKPENLSYILFGTTEELFLAHVVSSKPDFDHVLRVELDNHSFLESINSGSHEILEFPQLNNREPLRGESPIQARLKNELINITSLKEHYLEFDDLSF